MSHNPYAFAVPAAQAEPDVRAAFLKKVYSLVLGGVLAFAATLWAAGNIPSVSELCVSLWQLTRGHSLGWLVYMAITMGGFWVVHSLARTSPLNLIAYFTWTFVLGLLVAPPVLVTAANAPQTLTMAAMLTAITFTGITAYVITTKKDFSFLGGILSMGFWLLLGLALCGWLFGFHAPLLFSGLGVALFAGYIVYDTSNVVRNYPADMAVSAAVTLFTDLVYLFLHVLSLLNRLRDE